MIKYEKIAFLKSVKCKNNMNMELCEYRRWRVVNSILLILRKNQCNTYVPLSKIKLIFYKAKTSLLTRQHQGLKWQPALLTQVLPNNVAGEKAQTIQTYLQSSGLVHLWKTQNSVWEWGKRKTITAVQHNILQTEHDNKCSMSSISIWDTPGVG